MYHNYPHKRRVLCLKTLQAALNCCSSRCSLNHCSTCYHMNYWLFVSFLQIQRFCSVSTLLCRANVFFASSWISAVYLCSYTHFSLLLWSLVSVWTLRNTRVSWVWCSWWICWLEWRQGWSTSLKWASSTSGWLHTRWARFRDASVCVCTTGGRNLDFLWMSLFKEMLSHMEPFTASVCSCPWCNKSPDEKLKGAFC